MVNHKNDFKNISIFMTFKIVPFLTTFLFIIIVSLYL